MSKIRIAGTEFSLKRKAYEIYIQGCYRNCKGCHNPDTHSFSGGKEVEIGEFFEELHDRIQPFIDDGLIRRIYVSGGDLLCWDSRTAKEFGDHLTKHFLNVERWLFTGAEPMELPVWVWWYFNIVKCGRYREDMRNPEGTFPASKNQTLVFFYKLPQELFDSVEFEGVKTWS